MKFAAFILSSLFKIASIFFFIILEVVVFALIYKALIVEGMFAVADVLFYVFIVWIIIDIALRVFLGTGKSIFKYIGGIWSSSR